jgi:tRNA threonylcarbamoyladenosine biosynthesis protein TsaB
VLILSLDTSTRAGSAAVLRDDAVLAVAGGDPTRTHAERLPAELDAVLRAAGVSLRDIELLAVARGPGGFTGLRIGLAAMQGIAMVTGRPVVGVSALEALAVAAFATLQVDHARIGAWVDASRGEVFAAAYEAAGAPGGVPTLTTLCEAEVDAPAAVRSRWQALMPSPWTFTGDGAARYPEALVGVPVVPPPSIAPAVAHLARRQIGHHRHAPHDLQPLYVRRPDVERSIQP